MYQNNYNLNFVPGGVPLTIHISQYDVGTRTFHFTPIAVPGQVSTFTGASATLEATKPDGYAVIQNCTYNSDGSIDYTVQEQLAAKAGKVWSKIVLRNGSDVIGTAAVVWIVDKAGVTDDAIVSDSDVSGIRALVDAEVESSVGTYVDEAVEPIEADVDELKSAISNALPTASASGAIASFDDGAEDVPVKNLTVSIEPKQEGSGDPSPSNVRAISGWDAVKVTRAGKNIAKRFRTTSTTTNGVKFTMQGDGGVLVSGTATANAFCEYTYTGASNALDATPFRGMTMTASVVCDDPNVVLTATYYKQDGSFANFVSGYHRSVTFTVPSEAVGFRVPLEVPNGAIVTNSVAYMQIEPGSVATEYEPYNASEYTVSLASAGTVYGGTLDVTKGTLTVDRAMFNAKDKTWRWGGNTYVYTPITDTVLAERTQVICSHLGFMGGTGTLDGHCSWGGNPNNGNLCARSSTIAPTLADWNTYIASHDVQFVYYLANPQTYQLTPTEVRTLLGNNNIWADTGDSTVEYKADTGRYIENRISAQQKLISGVETSYTATKNYAIGNYVIVSDTLYKVTAAIASGATITPGTNCVATTVAEQLILLANA